jgi:fumarate reductase flavoprotein subunit
MINIDDKQAEIVIVGGGGAGLAAAVAAAEQGLKNIVILEERKVPGGNAVFPDGIFAADSPVQKRLGILCEKDDIFKKAMDYAHWRTNPRLVRALINKSGDTIRWLEDKGVKFEKISPIYPNDVPSTFHVTGGPGKTGAAIIKTLLKNCGDLNVQIISQTKGLKLLTNEKGEISGILANTKSDEFTITTSHIILATGGFTGDMQLLKKYLPNYDHQELNHTGTLRMGDGLRMATEIGAGLEDMFALEIMAPFIESKYLFFIVMRPETIWINRKGERFADEFISSRFTEAANSIYRQPGKVCYTILNEELKKYIVQDLLIKHKPWANLGSHEEWAANLDDEIRSQINTGKILKSDSWDEIAHWIGASPDIFKSSLETYNSFCESAYDDEFLKDKKYLLPIKKPPFYAIKCCIDCVATHGGIKVNDKMEIVDTQDNPVKGLYAAGLEIGGTDSETYNITYPGHSFGFTINSGRIAGENAARSIKRELSENKN